MDNDGITPVSRVTLGKNVYDGDWSYYQIPYAGGMFESENGVIVITYRIQYR